jgi:hypothetical protein
VSTDTKNLSDLGPEQNKKTTDETGDLRGDYEIFEISIDSFYNSRHLEMTGGATGIQAVLATEV